MQLLIYMLAIHHQVNKETAFTSFAAFTNGSLMWRSIQSLRAPVNRVGFLVTVENTRIRGTSKQNIL